MPRNDAQRAETARLRAEGLTLEAIGKAQGRTKAAVADQMAKMGGDAVLPSDSVMAKTRQAKLSLVYEQAKKVKAQNDFMSGKLVEKEKVNNVILAHRRRYNLALLHLREIDQKHDTNAAHWIEDAFRGFGEEVGNTLS